MLHLLGTSQRGRNTRRRRPAQAGAVLVAVASSACFPGYSYDLPVDGYGDVVRQDGPVRWLRLDERAGATLAADSSGGPDAQVHGSPLWEQPGAIAGSTRTALRLDGVDTSVALAGPLGLVGEAPFSVEAWMRPLSVSEQNLFIFGNAVGAETERDGYNLVVSMSGKVALARWSNGSYGEARGAPVSEDEWHHVVGTFDGAVLRIYLDGVQGEPGEELLLVDDESVSPTFGAPSANGHPFFEGWLDELAVYDEALTPERVSAHHAAGRGP
jgi:hypothetical protein